MGMLRWLRWGVACVACIAFLVGCASTESKTPVERHGALRVEGTFLLNEQGKKVQLRGISSHGLQWYGRYANRAVLQWLRDDWHIDVWRAALYLAEGGYIQNRALKQRVIDSIEAARDLGLYVVVDWHVLREGSPQAYKKEALEFFTEIASTYGHLPNLIYEICNEPNGKDVTWSGVIKPYAEEVIARIRQYDPDNLIIVGTPNWSQDVDVAAEDPITGWPNIMYTLHFYAGSHGKELRDKAERALARGLPIFVTEWGTTLASGHEGPFIKESEEWLAFLKRHSISWINWSLNNKGEDSGLLVYNADREGKGTWKEEDLSPSGKFIRKILRKRP
ncbi:MAG TPA: glycoside hydrolase family 5 protein [Termitinemataceae bacterium]|nr:glycoside hydrolase family 5 protein [Termitinemataceae bacterium]HPQ00529.1 glycoside hydrolase family 5 protein [Termitinemataceae bacterium]